MKSALEPLEGNKVKLSVEVDEAELDKAIDVAFRKIANEVRLPGFRPGKAPRRLLEARIGLGPAREQALRDAIPEYLAQAVREHEVDIIAQPEVDITAGQEDGPLAFDATIEVRPQVMVAGYAGLRVELPGVVVTDAEVDERVEALRRPYGDLSDVDRPAARGDYVTLDLAASREDEPVPGLNADAWLYEVGRGWVAPDFDEQLIGATPGDELSFTTTPSGTEDPADFEVTVQNVQELVLPDLTDEWVGENLDDVETVEAWRAKLRQQAEEVKLVQARQLLVERALSSLAGLVDEDPPQALVDTELRHQAEHAVQSLAQRGLNLDQWLAATGQDQLSFIESLRTDAARNVKVDLALRAVAEAEDLQASEDDLEDEYRRIGQQVGQKPAQVRRAYERNDAVGGLRAELRKRKAMEWLLRHVEVVDPEGQAIERSLLLPDEALTDAAAEATHTHDHAEGDHE